jgi:hypothetical protein
MSPQPQSNRGEPSPTHGFRTGAKRPSRAERHAPAEFPPLPETETDRAHKERTTPPTVAIPGRVAPRHTARYAKSGPVETQSLTRFEAHLRCGREQSREERKERQ